MTFFRYNEIKILNFPKNLRCEDHMEAYYRPILPYGSGFEGGGYIEIASTMIPNKTSNFIVPILVHESIHKLLEGFISVHSCNHFDTVCGKVEWYNLPKRNKRKFKSGQND